LNAQTRPLTQTRPLWTLAAFSLAISLAPLSVADSFRCEQKIASQGDTKADVLEKCGEPQLIDSFCQPIISGIQAQATDTSGTTTNSITTTSCENVDIWTYKRGSGRFITHLYFSRGQLQEIKLGDRAP